MNNVMIGACLSVAICMPLITFGILAGLNDIGEHLSEIRQALLKENYERQQAHRREQALLRISKSDTQGAAGYSNFVP